MLFGGSFDAARGWVEGEVGEEMGDRLEERTGPGGAAVGTDFGVGEAEVAFGARDSHVESACILADMVGVVFLDVLEKGIGSLGGVENNDAVELQPPWLCGLWR